MLEVISSKKDKILHQKELKNNLQRFLKSQGERTIGYPSGHIELPMHSNGTEKLWYSYMSDKDGTTPKFYNFFGIFDTKKASQNIAVEINIPLGDSKRISGFFAKDETGNVYLMHSGKIGGGKKGVGKSSFLVWSNRKINSIKIDSKKTRDGIVIGNIRNEDISFQIYKYAKSVSEFKDFVKTGGVEKSRFKRKIEEYEKYSREYSGIKSGKIKNNFEYYTYHGDIVDAIRREVSVDNNNIVCNTPLIDLYVKNKSKVTEIYEIKTNIGRQSLYTAIGQLATHSLQTEDKPKRILVIPESDTLPSDIIRAIEELNILVKKFRVSRSRKRPYITFV